VSCCYPGVFSLGIIYCLDKEITTLRSLTLPASLDEVIVSVSSFLTCTGYTKGKMAVDDELGRMC
jgi:hypothetical protein